MANPAPAFLVVTLGGVMVYSAITGTSIVDVLAGKQTDKLDAQGGFSPAETAADFAAGAAAGAVGGSTTPVHVGTGESSKGVTMFDGKPVARWMVPYLQYARLNGWKGKVTSGYRSPVYSESLCRAMCGAPSCSGTCAGRSSNHSGVEKPHGAVDVSDYETFGRLMATCPLSPRLFNDLPADRVHYSASGH